MMIYILAYILVLPVVYFTIKLVKDQLKNQMFNQRGNKRSQTALVQKQKAPTLTSKLSSALSFSLKEDKRGLKGISNRVIILSVYILGSLVATLAYFIESYALLLIASFLFPIIAVIYSYSSTKAILKKRKETLERMAVLKGERMGNVSQVNKYSPPNVNEEIRVLEWSDDYLFPMKMHLYMPTRFDKLRVGDFLTYFNELFNSYGNWVANTNDKENPGFDFNSGIASLAVTPKLPTRADWSDRFLNSDEFAWSFFPLGFSSENGVVSVNPTTGAKEHVIGFDLQNNQAKLSKKNGTPVGPEMVAAPQVLIAGATGGGKALALDTEIVVIKNA